MKPVTNPDGRFKKQLLLITFLFLSAGLYQYYLHAAILRLPILEQYVHAFYYMWYGNPVTDGQWIHWNAHGRHPPDDLASNYYPFLGAYSSENPLVMRYHLQWLRDAGVGTIVISYWGGVTPTFAALDELARLSLRYGIHWSFLIEPYPGINRATLERDFRVLTSRYRSLLFRVLRPTPDFPWEIPRPVFYIFNMGVLNHEQWIDLMRSFHHRKNGLFFVVNDITGTLAGWGTPDGFFSYTPAPGDLNARFHPLLKKTVASLGFAFIATVSPGFETNRYRHDLGFLHTPRRQGTHYDASWKLALRLKPDWIAIISFNEWHEGTQIEPAASKIPGGYRDYEGHYGSSGPAAPFIYLRRTRDWVNAWTNARLSASTQTAP